VSGLDQRLDPGTRQAIYLGGEIDIEALSGLRGSNHNLVDIPFIHHWR
jgi:hypothetical protein